MEADWADFGGDIGGFGKQLRGIGRAIAFEIYRPVTPAKAGVRRPQNEDNGSETADFRRWIPAFAGMPVAESTGSMSQRLKCDCPGGIGGVAIGRGVLARGHWDGLRDMELRDQLVFHVMRL